MANFNDTRLKQIMEEYKRLGPDDTFRFHCTQCGKCCRNREDILLNPRDLFRIAVHLKLTPKEVFDQYCEAYICQNSRIPIVRLKPQGPNLLCPLLKNRKCEVHEAKPSVCAMFPLGRMLEVPKDSSDVTNAKIQYLFSDPHCGDASEEHTVRQWLEDFGLPLQDEFFLNWQQTVLTLGDSIRKLEEDHVPFFMITVWDVIFTALYLNYQEDEDFGAQFQKNAEVICDFVRNLVEGDADV